MNFTLHQLQVYLRVVQLKSITRAAEELYMTQPAVSIQMKNFQDQFDIALTEVIGRKLYVTEFGMEIYRMAGRVLDEVSTLNSRTESFKGYITGRLLISSVSTGKYVIPYFLTQFMREHQGVDLVIDVTNRARVLSNLKNNEADFAVVYVLPKELRYHSETLVESALYLVGNTETRRPKRTLSKQELLDLPLIFREEGSGTRMVMENYFKKNHMHIQKKMELTSNEAVKQAVIAGLGYAIMPLIGIRNELQNGQLQLMQVRGFPIRSSWRLIWLKEKKLSPAATAYLDFIRNNKEQIIKKHFSWIEKFMD
ncbi:MAG TPA: LysR substrate-binding domain-containing protein [Bacteroidia bacterium]|nr:LysR substrate-binding domain-containing protein [Bacteroidia bacterium]